MSRNETEITFHSNEWNREHAENFQIGLMTKVETYPSTREIINVLIKLGGLPAETNIDRGTLFQVSHWLSQNSRTIHDWLYKLVNQRQSLSYSDEVNRIAYITIRDNDGIKTLQKDVLELEFPEGRRMCDASTIINCLYLLGRLDEPNREYESFELKDAADLILANGNQLAEYLSEQARLGRNMVIVAESAPEPFSDTSYFRSGKELTLQTV